MNIVSPHVIPVTTSSIAVWNTTYVLSFKVTDSQPQITNEDITWKYISGVLGEMKDITNEFNNRYVFSSNELVYTLTIFPVEVQDKGKYRLIAESIAGTSSAELEIKDVYGKSLFH